ncbi:hypothetical protein [Curtobacterium sp. 9128]|nr:hypothetical protein [Curtobacterium sp. 9128]
MSNRSQGSRPPKRPGRTPPWLWVMLAVVAVAAVVLVVLALLTR